MAVAAVAVNSASCPLFAQGRGDDMHSPHIADKSGSGKPVSHAKDEDEIRAQARAYATAFENGDAGAISSMFSSDAVLTDQSGRVLVGRDQISKYTADFFKNAGRQPMTIVIESVNFLADDVAVERGLTQLTGASSGRGNMPTRYTAIHVKRDGKWQMVNVSEVGLPGRPDPRRVTDLSWLIGSWRADGPGGSMTLKSSWAADKKVIRCDYVANLSNGTTRTNTQFIYFDPVSNELRSWQYDGLGGYGQSTWRGSRGNWIASACSVQADGSTGTARYVLSKVDDNQFTWQSTSRTLLGRSLSDTPKLLVKRDN